MGSGSAVPGWGPVRWHLCCGYYVGESEQFDGDEQSPPWPGGLCVFCGVWIFVKVSLPLSVSQSIEAARALPLSVTKYTKHLEGLTDLIRSHFLPPSCDRYHWSSYCLLTSPEAATRSELGPWGCLGMLSEAHEMAKLTVCARKSCVRLPTHLLTQRC